MIEHQGEGVDLRAKVADAIAASLAREDPDYPLFHIAPPVGRLNDPNGLVLREGRYHAFYQFSPFHPQRQVFWGHASSADLTTWQPHPVAVLPDAWYDRNGVYSGSALPLEDAVEFYYTGNVRNEQDERESYQCLVSSPDLVTFDKSSANPLLGDVPGYTAHIRDPQVVGESDGTYRMCVGAQRDDETGCVLIFRSKDRRTWTLAGELTFPDAEGRFDAFGFMWECPSLIRVPDGDGVRVHDVLIVSPQGIPDQPEGFANIFACGYVVGQLEGTALRAATEFVELDRGFEFYAPQVFAGTPQGEAPLMMAWLGNASEDEQPSMEHGWVHALSVARELVVVDGRLRQRPRLELSGAREVAADVPGLLGHAEVPVAGLAGSRAFRLTLQVEAEAGGSWRVRLGEAERHVDLEFADGCLTVDRRSTRYPHGERRVVRLPAVTGVLDVEVVHDRSVTEIFVADGALAFSLRSYLDGASGASVAGEGRLRIASVQAHRFD